MQPTRTSVQPPFPAPGEGAKVDIASMDQPASERGAVIVGVRPWVRHSVIAAIISILVICLAWVALLQEKQRYRERASEATQNIARLLDQQTHSVFDKIDIALRTSANFYVDLQGAALLDGRKLNQYLAQQESLLPEVNSFRITDRLGIVRYGRGVSSNEPVDLSDREYFIKARDQASEGLIVSGPVFARITKQWVMVLARRLNAPDGSFAGVIYANLTCASFERVLSLATLGPHGAATLRTNDLALVHRVPDTRNAVGGRDVSQQLRESLASKPTEGAYIAVTKLDGVERSNAYRKIQDYSLYVIVGLATEDYLGGWHKNAVLIACLAGLTLLVTWLASARVIASQRRLNEDVEKRAQISLALEQAMAELELRKVALEQINVTLEQKVAERTVELSKANRELERLARRDTLTRLGNRLSADEHLHEEFLRMKRSGVSYALLLIDIDHFKHVNDSFGHEQGDVVLKHIAKALNRSCRATDFVARFGGEEFLAILPNTNREHAAIVAEKMRAAVAAVAVEPVGHVTVSIGVAMAAAADAEETVALRCADKNLYQAKTQGRNQVVCAECSGAVVGEPKYHLA